MVPPNELKRKALVKPGRLLAAARAKSPAPATGQRLTADDRYWHALGALRPRISARRLAALLQAAGGVEAAWRADIPLLRRAGWTPEAIAYFQSRRRDWNLEQEAARLDAGNVLLVPLARSPYPPLLRQCHDPPLVLYVRGAWPAGRATVAVVGSRRASPYGRLATQMLVRPLAARGLVVVSGLAFGIDAEAHRASLQAGGRTVAVLGSGVDEFSLYPRAHRELARAIVEGGGAVISEFPPGTGARGEYFPQRNRIIAGLAQAVVVVEAARRSGALITARLALEENREVFAVPGPITADSSAGTNALLQEGAAPALTASDILAALPGEVAAAAPPAFSPPSPADPAAARLLNLLSSRPQSLDDLASASQLSAAAVAAALSLLELDGIARDVGGKHYIRIR